MRDTRAEWETLAQRWDAARRRAWPAVEAFAESFRPGERVLDLAAGNGRHGAVAAKAGARVVAADFSRSLLAFARERGLPTFVAEARELPFRPGSFDGALFVAGLHCIPGRPQRLGALAELRRVLRPGGRALVTVWSRFHDGASGATVADPAALRRILRSPFVADRDVPWGDVDRYYHFYTPIELLADCRAAGFAEVKLQGEKVSKAARWLPDNWFVRLRA
jgi:ubiquinone/menaquinone biosynthesis C-methylase UbiE